MKDRQVNFLSLACVWQGLTVLAGSAHAHKDCLLFYFFELLASRLNNKHLSSLFTAGAICSPHTCELLSTACFIVQTIHRAVMNFVMDTGHADLWVVWMYCGD